MHVKRDVQLAGYFDTCFLFRMNEIGEGESHLPMGSEGLGSSWSALLCALQMSLADRGETDRNGAPIHLLPLLERRRQGTCTAQLPLFSLRISLITALALEGHLASPVLQKLVGHSRLVTTLYYTQARREAHPRCAARRGGVDIEGI